MLWTPLLPVTDAFEIVVCMFEPPPWTVCRDAQGRWCVQRLTDWPCTIVLTGLGSITDDRLESHARDVAACLNRVYAP